jgi:pimeloyl-ACP methyl ester carboxylesterase
MKWIKRIGISLLLLVTALILTYILGPKANFEEVTPDLPTLSISIDQLEGYIAEREGKVDNLKPENESRIIWADSVRQTEYALVYLHGFSAGVMEGAPLHMEVARRYSMNLYLPRLSKHGIADKDIFTQLTPAQLVNDAKEALVVGRKLGKKVILMSCSTGSTLGIYLTAHHPDVFAHVMFSPNISLFDPTGEMLTGPWGLQIVRKVVGDYRVPSPEKEPKPDSVQAKIDLYWSGTYRVEGLVALQSLIDQTMIDDVFTKVNQPYFMGYYYKNDTAQDMTVSVARMLEFDAVTQTPAQNKRLVAFANAGEHVINSPLISKDYNRVKEETFAFFEDILGFQEAVVYPREDEY